MAGAYEAALPASTGFPLTRPRALIDTEVATLTAGWSQHSFIKKKLAKKGISLTPLMLVQVEDQ
jgi:hypothetical protein